MKKKQPKRAEQEQSSTRSFWSGTITFGLVSIPVDLFPATRNSHLALRILDHKGRPLKRRYFSEKTGRALDDNDLMKGYEVRKDRFIEVSDAELERLQPEKTRDINLERFVDESSIPPLFFNHPYFLAPSSSSTKSYRLLAEVMNKTGQAGVATFVMRGKAYLVVIFSEGGVLRASTLRFSEEVRSPKEVGLPKRIEPDAVTVRRFETAIEAKSRKTLTRKFLVDEQSHQLESYARKKFSRRKDTVRSKAAPEKPAEVIDIMSILKKSLEQNRRAA